MKIRAKLLKKEQEEQLKDQDFQAAMLFEDNFILY